MTNNWTIRQILNRAKLICDIVLSSSLQNKDSKKTQRDIFVKLINMLSPEYKSIMKNYWLAKYNNDPELSKYEVAVNKLIDTHKNDKINYIKGPCKTQVGSWYIAPRFTQIRIYQNMSVNEVGSSATTVQDVGHNNPENRKVAGLIAWKHNNEFGYYNEI